MNRKSATHVHFSHSGRLFVIAIIFTYSETKSNEEASTTPRDPLHTVPWQLSTAEENEGEDGEPQTGDKGVGEAPLSPTPDEPLHLGMLPYGVLQEIALLLDRETLHEVALTSHSLRELAASVLKKKGLVETRWKRVDGKWAEDGRVRE